MAHEGHTRSIVKGLSWRAFATMDTIILAYLFTGSFTSAFSIGGLEILTKVLWFYLHERTWLFVSFPRAHPRIASLFDHQSKGRAVFKAISWRFVGALDTPLIAFVITRHVAASVSIGGAEFFTKTVLYYLHERMWSHIIWGMPVQSAVESEDALRNFFQNLKNSLWAIRQKVLAVWFALACVLFVVLMALITYALRN